MHLALLPVLALAFAFGGARAQSATPNKYVCPSMVRTSSISSSHEDFL